MRLESQPAVLFLAERPKTIHYRYVTHASYWKIKAK